MPAVRQYDRGVRVWIFPPYDLANQNPQAPLIINRQVPISGLLAPTQSAVEFTVSRTLSPEPTGATVRLYNLTATTRDRISGTVRRPANWRPEQAGRAAAVFQVDGLFQAGSPEFVSQISGMCGIRVEAGYSGVLGQVFLGTVTRQRTYRQGPQTITDLGCTDGGFQVGVAVANRVFGPNTPALSVVQYLAGTMGLQLAQTTGLGLLTGFKLPGGMNCTGDPHAGIRDILAPLQLAWWIEDGQIWVLADGETLPGDPVVVSVQPLPNAIRLRGEPEVLDQGGLQIRCTLAPQIRLGHAVLVAGSDQRGTYRVETVQHGGFNRGGSYETAAVIRSPSAAL